jgi:hypothetical protein
MEQLSDEEHALYACGPSGLEQARAFGDEDEDEDEDDEEEEIDEPGGGWRERLRFPISEASRQAVLARRGSVPAVAALDALDGRVRECLRVLAAGEVLARASGEEVLRASAALVVGHIALLSMDAAVEGESAPVGAGDGDEVDDVIAAALMMAGEAEE